VKKGITRRWLINTLGVILAILVTIIVVLSFSIQTFYYNGIQQTISGRSNELVNFFGNYTAADTEQFNTTAREYVENFPDKELMELIGMCDRIMIMKDGKISGELERDQNLDENGLITMMV